MGRHCQRGHGRCGLGVRGTYTPVTRDAEVEQLRRRLQEYRDENDSLGEAVRAMKAALDAANEDAANAETLRNERDEAKEEMAKTKALLAKADATLRNLKDRVAEMEQLCLDQQEDVIASNQAMEAAKEKLVEAKGAAQASSEDAKAAQAMATELRDRVALLEADADIKASQQGIIEGLKWPSRRRDRLRPARRRTVRRSSPSGGASGRRPRTSTLPSSGAGGRGWRCSRPT